MEEGGPLLRSFRSLTLKGRFLLSPERRPLPNSDKEDTQTNIHTYTQARKMSLKPTPEE
jgi:hypothetical protein